MPLEESGCEAFRNSVLVSASGEVKRASQVGQILQWSRISPEHWGHRRARDGCMRNPFYRASVRGHGRADSWNNPVQLVTTVMAADSRGFRTRKRPSGAMS